MPMKRTVTLENAPPKRRRTYNKRKAYTPKRIVGGINFNPVPDALKVRMRFTKVITLTPLSNINAFAFHSFRANSVYDPDYTSLGNRRALGLSLYDDLYSKYRVKRCAIRVQCIDNINTGVLFIVKNQTSNGPTSSDTTTMLEKDGTKSSVLRLRDNSGLVWNKFEMDKDMSLRQAEWVDTTSNPTIDDDWYFHVCLARGNTGNSEFLVDMWYDVELSGKITAPTA